MNIFIEASTFYFIARSYLRYFKFYFSIVTRRINARYLPIKPLCFKQQVIYDRLERCHFRLFLRNKSDLSTLVQIYLQETYDFQKLSRAKEIERRYLEIIKSGKNPLILDLGANIGLAAKYFHQNFPLSTVICVEPDPGNITFCKLNNNFSTTSFLLAAVGCEPGYGVIKEMEVDKNAFQIERKVDGNVEIINVEQILENYPSATHTPFIAKIDIEGFESDLFLRNTDWVERFPLIIIELHDWMFPGRNISSNFLQTISLLKRDFVYFGESVFSISNN